MNLKTLLCATVAAGALAISVATAAEVTDATLADPAPGDWLGYGRASDNYRHSPLTEITPENVRGLTLVWARAMEPGPVQGSPIVHDGIMYLPNPRDVIQAIDVRTGDLIWEHRRELGDTLELHSLGDRKRGIALYKGRVYFNTWDNHLVALDAASGEVAFVVDRGNAADLVSYTSAPVVANGVLVMGSSCQYTEFGCFISGHDPETGKELWRNTFIPKPGEEGDETWGNPFEDRWLTGAWGHITYDPKLDLVHFGSSGAGPAAEVQRGTPGGTLYGSNTRFAVRPKTGEIVWRHQTLPRDNWDQECVFEMLTADIEVSPDPQMEGLRAIGPNASGPRRVLTGIPCKTGIMWQFDAETGEFLWARDTVKQTVVESIDAKGLVTVNEAAVIKEVETPVPFCPSQLGGRNWFPAAFNPKSGVYFITMTNVCSEASAIDQDFTGLDHYNTETIQMLPDGVTEAGRIDAIDITTGRTVWSRTQSNPIYAPIMSTDTGLLFVGGVDREFKALDQKTGDTLWSVRLATGATGHPIAFEVDGRQYVAIPGGGANLGTGYFSGMHEPIDAPAAGGAVYVFALPED